MFGKGYALSRMGVAGLSGDEYGQIREKVTHFFIQNRENHLQPHSFCAIITKHYTRITMPFCALLG